MSRTGSHGSQPPLLLAAHGTKSSAGAATTAAIAAAVANARPDLNVSLCYVDVLEPSLATALDELVGPTIVVPLLLSSGYHVQTDIPAVVNGRTDVHVARHLGPEPAIADVLADRLAEARGEIEPATTALVAVGSSRGEAREETQRMADLLSDRVGRRVALVPLAADISTALGALPAPVEIASYLLAEGVFWEGLRAAAAELGTVSAVAAPIGVAPGLIELVLARYAETAGSPVR